MQPRRGDRRLLLLLAVLTAARVVYGLQFQSVGAVAPAMVADLGLDYAALGTLVGAFSTLGLALALPAGWLIARLGERRSVLAGLGLMAAGGALLAAAPGFDAALAGRLASGAGAMLLIVALPTVVAGRFAGAALPAAMGTLLAGYPLGIGLGFLALPLIQPWRAAIAATAVLALLVFAVAAKLMAGPAPNAAPAAARPRFGGSAFPARRAAAVAAAGLVWGCSNAAFATVVAGPLGGWVLGRLVRPVLGIAAGLALATLALASLAGGGDPVAMLVGIGLALGTVAGPIVALPAAMLSPERRALGMGLFWLLFFAPMTLLPPLAGLARDLTGTAAAPLWAAAAFMAWGWSPSRRTSSCARRWRPRKRRAGKAERRLFDQRRQHALRGERAGRSGVACSGRVRVPWR